MEELNQTLQATKSILGDLFPFLIGFGIGILPSCFKKKKEDEYLKFKAEGIKVAKLRPVLMMDSTKRKSLQPSNQQPIPQGWDSIKAEVKKNMIPKPPQTSTAGLEKPFSHKFYGTKLIVEGATIISGLQKRTHKMEIVGNQMFLDNKIVDINIGDLERLKDLIRKSRV